MKTNRIALSAALLASTTLVPVAAFAQDAQIEDQITVRYQYIPDDRRVTSEVSAVLSLDDLETTGDSDLAGALVRITGISTTGGRFAVVRGLNERYSNTLLNGSPMPSPEPLRRAAPLDIFPTNLLSNVLVQKTFSPQYPGEFGGGVIAIETSTLPNEGFLSVSVGGSFDTITTGNDGFTYAGSDTDWMGYDDGLRDVPAGLAAIWNDVSLSGSALSSAEKAALGAEFVNSELWVMQQVDVDANGDFAVNLGDRFDFDNFSLGLLGAFAYDNSWQTREGTRGLAGADGYQRGPLDLNTYDQLVSVDEIYDNYSATENTVDVSAMVSAGIDFYNDHEFNALVMVLRSTAKEARRLIELDDQSDIAQQVDSMDYFERETVFTQLSGSHVFEALGGLELDWRYSDATANRDAPYERSYAYEFRSDGSLFLDIARNSNNSTRFSYVEDETSDYGFDISFPLTVADFDVELTAGYSNVERDRESTQRAYRFVTSNRGPDSYLRDIEDSRIDYIFAEPNFAADGWVLDELPAGNSSPQLYTGELDVEAAYFGADVEVNPFIRVAAGVRFEESDINVATFEIPGDGTASFDRRTFADANPQFTFMQPREYTLPSVTFTWTFADNLQLRTGYSETIARPQFRELAPAEFTDATTDKRYIGNPFLRDTEVENFDARLEYYFGREQFVTVGVFQKVLENPIEERIRPRGDDAFYDFINAPEATLEGYEIEFEKTFDFSDRFNSSFFTANEFFVKTNYTNISSEVNVEDGDEVIIRGGSILNPSATVAAADTVINDGRQLQGQSEHLFNLQLGFESFDGRERAAILFNYTSERIRSVAQLGFDSTLGTAVPITPEVVEEVPMSLDFVYSRTVTVADADWDLGFSVRNITGDDYRAYAEVEDGGETIELPVDTYSVGTTFGFSISREW